MKFPAIRATSKNGVFETTEDINFEVDGTTYTVEVGFLTDLTSIPWYLRWLFPFGGPKLYAAIVHDWLYKNGLLGKSMSDSIFLKYLLKYEVPFWQAYAMYYAVRYLGFIAWNGHRSKDAP